jgi:hypothetical protein
MAFLRWHKLVATKVKRETIGKRKKTLINQIKTPEQSNGHVIRNDIAGA